MEKVKVPAGLKKCKTCGHYKGFCFVREDRTKKHRISCACHNQICKRCGKKVHKFPIGSLYYKEETGSFISVNFISGMAHMAECVGR